MFGGYYSLKTGLKQVLEEIQNEQNIEFAPPSLVRNHIQFGPSLEHINGYGCWCYFNEEDHGKGRGAPVNVIDKLCKNLYDGYDCINLDDENCEPYTVENDVLMSPTGFSNTSNFADLHSSCTAITDTNCEAMTCIVESQFLSSLLQIYIENNFDSALLYGDGRPLDAQSWPRPFSVGILFVFLA